MAYDPNGGNAPSGLKRATAPFLLVMPWAIEHGLMAPTSVEGVSAAEVTQVCVLLRSLSRFLLRLSGGSGLYGPPAREWVEANMTVTRCADHDWCETRRVPCSTDSPERVLVAVLEQYGVWSISWLAQRWCESRHFSGISGFMLGGTVTAPIRPAPAVPRPQRSLEELAAPALVDRCRNSSRQVRPGVSVACGVVRQPQPLVKLFLPKRCASPCRSMLKGLTCCSHTGCRREQTNIEHSEAIRVEWVKKGRVLELEGLISRSPHYYSEHKATIDERLAEARAEHAIAITNAQSTAPSLAPVAVRASMRVHPRSKPESWRPFKVCVCDATVEELEAVYRLRIDYETVSFWDWEAKRAVIVRNAERGQKAAATRRENDRKRKLAAVVDLSDCEDDLFF